MELNKNQKIILACTIAVIILMFLYPPFHLIDTKGIERNLGYSFLTDAPNTYISPGGYYVSGSVTVGVLLLQIFVTLLVGGGLLLLYKTEKQPSKLKGDANEAQKKKDDGKTETKEAVKPKKNRFVGGLIVILPFIVAKPFLSDIATYNEPLMWFVIALLMCASYGLWYLWYYGGKGKKSQKIMKEAKAFADDIIDLIEIAKETEVPIFEKDVEALQKGDVAVVYFPYGTRKEDIPPVPYGFKKTSVRKALGAGLYYFNPEHVLSQDIMKAAREGTQEELLKAKLYPLRLPR